MEREGTNSWLGLSTQRLPIVCTRAPQEPQVRSRPAWLAGLHGTIPSRMGVVLPFLLPCFIQTPTRQRLILTRSPINLHFFGYFGGGGSSHRPRTNLSLFFFCLAWRPISSMVMWGEHATVDRRRATSGTRSSVQFRDSY